MCHPAGAGVPGGSCCTGKGPSVPGTGGEGGDPPNTAMQGDFRAGMPCASSSGNPPGRAGAVVLSIPVLAEHPRDSGGCSVLCPQLGALAVGSTSFHRLCGGS